MVRVNLSLSEELVAKLDKYAKDNFMTRSALVSFACNQFLTSFEIVDLMRQATLCMREIADKGIADEKAMKELEDMEYLLKLITSGRNK
ncbi:MAG: hypothetical protein K2J08_08070 [Ruminococcus sp.]|nr:hypothetical protein [Ruminococcus sp.]